MILYSDTDTGEIRVINPNKAYEVCKMIIDGFTVDEVYGLAEEALKGSSGPKCARCGSPIDTRDGLCTDETCPFSDVQQGDPDGWRGHPEPPRGVKWPNPNQHG